MSIVPNLGATFHVWNFHHVREAHTSMDMHRQVANGQAGGERHDSTCIGTKMQVEKVV